MLTRLAADLASMAGFRHVSFANKLANVFASEFTPTYPPEYLTALRKQCHETRISLEPVGLLGQSIINCIDRWEALNPQRVAS